MVKHIVMWTLKDEHNGLNKEAIANEMKAQLLALKNTVSVLVDIQVGINGINFNKNMDIVLSTDFKTFEDLLKYAGHPEHLKVVDFVKEVAIDRACVDYEY